MARRVLNDGLDCPVRSGNERVGVLIDGLDIEQVKALDALKLPNSPCRVVGLCQTLDPPPMFLNTIHAIRPLLHGFSN